MKYVVTKIAGHVIELGAVSPKAVRRFSDFSSEEKPELFVHITRERLDYELIHYRATEKQPYLINERQEFVTLLRMLSETLIDYDTFLMHGAVIAADGKAYLFTAPSGTGKTTHIRQWLERLPGAFVVNGDKPFIKTSGDGTPPLACGSPWGGKENLYTDAMVPLKAVILMERAEDNHMERVSFAEAFPTLLQQVYRPEDKGKMRKTLQLMQRLNPAVSFWRFRCNNFKPDCFDTAYSALTGEQAP